MFPNLIILTSLISTSVRCQHYNGPLAGGLPASLYPAGIDPKACPNFPNCANPFVALSKSAEPAPAQPQQQLFQPQQYAGVAPQQYAAQQYAAQQYAAQQYSPGVASQQYAAAPQQYAPAPQPQDPPLPAHLQAALNRGEYIGDGDYRGEGLAESQAPGPVAAAPQYSAAQYSPSSLAQYGGAGGLQYSVGAGAIPQQYTQRTALQYSAAAAAPAQYATVNSAVAPQAAPANIPAGLHPQACPNYPFCHQ